MGEKVKVRQQERIEEVKCFRCWGVGHHKWKCPNIEVERQKGRSEQTAYVVKPQKAQEYYNKRSISLEEALLLEKG